MDQQEFDREAQLEQFRSVMQMATMSVKNAVLINGGGAIALLTFLGNAKFEFSIDSLVLALQLFCIGVALGAFSTPFGYFAQNRHLTSIKKNEDNRPGTKFGVIAAVLVLLSYTVFVVGCISASLSFS